MSRRVAVLRPEPGNAATVARVEAAGLAAIRLPLFAVRALDWTPPDPAEFDALILTSANAPRLAGPGLDRFAHLPVHAVGAATADAARKRGLTVAATGASDAADLAATLAARGFSRALLLTGREHRLRAGGVVAAAVPVYASDPQPIEPAAIAALAGQVVLLHSARAAEHFAGLAASIRDTVRIAALSPAVAEAAGTGWDRIVAAPLPDDAALVALAGALAD